MIRINLLPRKVTKKKLTIIRHLVLSSLILLLVLIGLGYWWSALAGKVAALDAEVARAKAEKESLKNVNAEKEQFEKSISELKTRIDAITEIQKGRFVPLYIMDEITRAMEGQLPVWLTRVQTDGKLIQMDGNSFTNPDIARFAQLLEAMPHIKGVDLLFSQKNKIGEREIFNFSINAQVELPQSAAPPEKKP